MFISKSNLSQWGGLPIPFPRYTNIAYKTSGTLCARQPLLQLVFGTEGIYRTRHTHTQIALNLIIYIFFFGKANVAWEWKKLCYWYSTWLQPLRLITLKAAVLLLPAVDSMNVIGLWSKSQTQLLPFISLLHYNTLFYPNWIFSLPISIIYQLKYIGIVYVFILFSSEIFGSPQGQV